MKLASRKDLNKFQGSKDSRGLKNVSKDQPNKQHENLQKKATKIIKKGKPERRKDELEISEVNLIDLLRDHLYKIRSSLLPSFSL